jgi:hypothetical protein
MPFKHEKFVAKVKDENPEHLEDDEQVEEAVPGDTGSSSTTPLLVFVDLVRRFRGRVGSRLLILTDRNLYVAITGMTRPWRIKEVKARYPRSAAGAHLREYAKGGVVEVDGERIHFQFPIAKHVRALVNAAGGGGAKPAE